MVFFTYVFVIDSGTPVDYDDNLYSDDVEDYFKVSDNFKLQLHNENFNRIIESNNESTHYYIRVIEEDNLNLHHINYQNNTSTDYIEYEEGQLDKEEDDVYIGSSYVRERYNEGFSHYTFNVIDNKVKLDDTRIENHGPKSYENHDVIKYEFKKYDDSYRFGLLPQERGEFYVHENKNVLMYYSITNSELDFHLEFNVSKNENVEKPDWI